MKKEYIQNIRENIKLEILGKIKTSNDKHKIKCLLCEDTFYATPKSKVTNYKKHKLSGCPKCTRIKRYKIAHDNNIEKIKERFIIHTDLSKETFNNNLIIDLTNKQCQHRFKVKTGNILNRNVECPTCNTEKKRQRLIGFNEDKFQQSIAGKSGFDRYQSEVRVLTERTYRENEKFINPNDLPRGLSGTDGAYHLDHIISIKYCFSNNIPVEICSHRDNLRIIPWKQNAVKWKRPTIYFPKIFWQYVDNYDEKRKFIKRVGEIKSLNVCSEINDYDYGLDLINLDKTIGVLIHRFDDIQEQTVGTKRYLFNMTEYFSNLGIRVIHVFEHEWLGKPELVLKRLTHIVGDNNITNKIYARKCDIGLVSSEDKSELLNANHVQGNDNATISYGAYHNGNLVAIMTFTKARVFMKGKKSKSIKWELSRFATDTNYIVVGIASKLLSHFKKNHDWDEIYSFADLRWSDVNSNVYESLGFEKSGSSLSYHYVVDGEYKHRWNYQKKQLSEKYKEVYDDKLTEYQNMLNIGYDRIWDCGILKYSMHYQ